MNDPWDSIEGRDIEDTMEAASRTISQTIRHFKSKDIQSVLPVTEKIKTDVEHFKQYVKLAVALRKPGMRERHWEELSGRVGFTVRPCEGFTLSTVIRLGLQRHEEFCEEIGERAHREHQIERKLGEMLQEWSTIEFDVLPAKSTDSHILGGLERIQNTLDEHTVATQSMQFSAFKKPFEERIEDWAGTLLRVQDTLDAWFKCQVN